MAAGSSPHGQGEFPPGPQDLPKKFFRQLPAILVNGTTQLPRTFALTWDYVGHTDSSFRLRRSAPSSAGFRRSTRWRFGEIWAVPAILRYVLLENLRRLSDRVETSRRMRERANDLADRLASSELVGDVAQSLHGYEADTADTSFVAQLLYRLREDTNSASKALTWLEQKLEDRQSDAEEVMTPNTPRSPRQCHRRQHHSQPSAHQRFRLDHLV